MPSQPDESALEDVRNALQLVHNLRTFEMASVESTRHEKSLNAIVDRLWAATKKLERKP